MKVVCGFSIILALVAMKALPVHAQEERFSIIGRLQLPAGYTTCERCSVELQDGHGQRRTITSGLLEEFSFGNLASGVYFLHVRSNDFEDLSQAVSLHSATARVSIDLRLRKMDETLRTLAGEVLDRSAMLGVYPSKAIELYKQALSSRRKNDTPEAIRLLAEAIRIAPNFYPAHADLGDSYKSLGRLDDAENEYRAAARINSSSPDPLIQLARLYILRREWDSAMRASIEAIRRDSQSALAFFDLGVSLYCFGMFETSGDAFRKALNRDPRMHQARPFLINVHLKSRQWDAALKEIDRYLSAAPRGAEWSQVSALRSRLRDRSRSIEGLDIDSRIPAGPVLRNGVCEN